MPDLTFLILNFLCMNNRERNGGVTRPLNLHSRAAKRHREYDTRHRHRGYFEGFSAGRHARVEARRCARTAAARGTILGTRNPANSLSAAPMEGLENRSDLPSALDLRTPGH